MLYAASLAAGNMNPVAYMNTVLGRWHSEGITSAEKAKAYKPASVAATPVSKEVNKTYTSEQLNAMFDSLNYEDL